MIKLIGNELQKIFKRKNIYFLLLIAVTVIVGLNIFEKISSKEIDIKSQYISSYNSDKFKLDSYEYLRLEEEYSVVLERVKLEEYAIEKGIDYNILLNSENKNMALPNDARILLMKFFDNSDIALIIIIVYISSTIVAEEFVSGTIKNLLIKPHTRIKIISSKILVILLICLILPIIFLITQYIVGGLVFGFDSYSLSAIRFNHIKSNIEVIPMYKYITIIIISKLPMYIGIGLISILIGIITSNVALNILLSIGIYIISIIKNPVIQAMSIYKYISIYNWDFSKYLFGNNYNLINNNIIIPIVSSLITLIIIYLFIISMFKNKEVTNER